MNPPDHEYEDYLRDRLSELEDALRRIAQWSIGDDDEDAADDAHRLQRMAEEALAD